MNEQGNEVRGRRSQRTAEVEITIEYLKEFFDSLDKELIEEIKKENPMFAFRYQSVVAFLNTPINDQELINHVAELLEGINETLERYIRINSKKAVSNQPPEEERIEEQEISEEAQKLINDILAISSKYTDDIRSQLKEKNIAIKGRLQYIEKYEPNLRNLSIEELRLIKNAWEDVERMSQYYPELFDSLASSRTETEIDPSNPTVSQQLHRNILTSEMIALRNEITSIRSLFSKEVLEKLRLDEKYAPLLVQIDEVGQQIMSMDFETLKTCRDLWNELKRMAIEDNIINNGRINPIKPAIPLQPLSQPVFDNDTLINNLKKTTENISIPVFLDENEFLANVVGYRKYVDPKGYTIIQYDVGNNKSYTSIVQFTLDRNAIDEPFKDLEREVERIKAELKGKSDPKVSQDEKKDLIESFKDAPAGTSINLLNKALRASQVYFLYKQMIMYLKFELGEAERKNNQSMKGYIASILREKESNLNTLEYNFKLNQAEINEFLPLWYGQSVPSYPDIKPVCNTPSELYEANVAEEKRAFKLSTANSINLDEKEKILHSLAKIPIIGRLAVQRHISKLNLIPTEEIDFCIKDIIEKKLTSQEQIKTLNSDDIFSSVYKKSNYDINIDNINKYPYQSLANIEEVRKI